MIEPQIVIDEFINLICVCNIFVLIMIGFQAIGRGIMRSQLRGNILPSFSSISTKQQITWSHSYNTTYLGKFNQFRVGVVRSPYLDYQS